MYPPIFSVCIANAGVTAVLGLNPTRLYPFGEAPQNVAKPYAVWQILSGEPENYLATTPDMDSWTIQVDCYASTGTACRNAAAAIRNAIQGVAHITFWNGEGRDPDTNNYRYTFTVDWFKSR